MNILFRISQRELEQYLAEDIPYIDLTTHLLGISEKLGQIEYFTREDCILCGTEEVVQMGSMLGLTVVEQQPSGSLIKANETFLVLKGPASALHQLWKVGLNVFEYTSAVATRTHKMVQEIHAVNPQCQLVTTRKTLPGAKSLLVKGILAGGAYPHRLGLSETVLIFKQHRTFFGQYEELLEAIPAIKHKCIEKKLIVEASAEEAIDFARAGVDGIQLDKLPSSQVAELVKELRQINPSILLIGTGGITLENAAEYAATGVDSLASTFPYHIKPVDMSARMTAN